MLIGLCFCCQGAVLNLPYIDNDAVRSAADIAAANRTNPAPMQFGVEQKLNQIDIMESGVESKVCRMLSWCGSALYVSLPTNSHCLAISLCVCVNIYIYVYMWMCLRSSGFLPIQLRYR